MAIHAGIAQERKSASAAAPAALWPPPVIPAPPVKLVGERLGKETRFAQYFATHIQNNDVNQRIPRDNFMEDALAPRAPGGMVPNPYRGKSINCRTCHFVEEMRQLVTPNGSRSYTDFQRRSRLPVRPDGLVVTVRNSSTMVDTLIGPPETLLLLRGGEFTRAEDVAIAGLTGRNFGWLPGEKQQAIANLARVIREDDGKDRLAHRYGAIPYAKLLAGESPEIPDEYRLPAEYRVDVTRASDRQILDAVAHIMAGYMANINLSRDREGRYNGSVYDLFLSKNGLPAKPEPGESDLEYSQRLLRQLESLKDPQWVGPSDGNLQYFVHQPFVFAESEMEGLKIFLRLSPQNTASSAAREDHANARPLVVAASASVGLPKSTHAGNCAACHTPPHFTDFKFHNTGVAQQEYDSVHGTGAFARLDIPGYEERQRNPDAYLPVTSHHPRASAVFRLPVNASNPGRVDLGMWNVYANDDFAASQPIMQKLLCAPGLICDREQLLPLTIARFKTATVRDLGQSDPYLHTGEKDTIEDVLIFYQEVSALAREGKLRNADPEIAGINLDELDVVYVAAFLRSLNEDYD